MSNSCSANQDKLSNILMAIFCLLPAFATLAQDKTTDATRMIVEKFCTAIINTEITGTSFPSDSPPSEWKFDAKKRTDFRVFVGDLGKYREDLKIFHGPLLQIDQLAWNGKSQYSHSFRAPFPTPKRLVITPQRHNGNLCTSYVALQTGLREQDQDLSARIRSKDVVAKLDVSSKERRFIVTLGNQLTLVITIDATGRLVKYESAHNGQTSNTWSFSDFRRFRQIEFPHRWEVTMQDYKKVTLIKSITPIDAAALTPDLFKVKPQNGWLVVDQVNGKSGIYGKDSGPEEVPKGK